MCFQNGMHFFCPKPIDTGMLRELIQIRKESHSLTEAIAWIELRMENQSTSASASASLKPAGVEGVGDSDSEAEERDEEAGAGAGGGVTKSPLFVNTAGGSARRWRITKA
jgi:hypothetical protein